MYHPDEIKILQKQSHNWLSYVSNTNQEKKAPGTVEDLRQVLRFHENR